MSSQVGQVKHEAEVTPETSSVDCSRQGDMQSRTCSRQDNDVFKFSGVQPHSQNTQEDKMAHRLAESQGSLACGFDCVERPDRRVVVEEVDDDADCDICC